MLCPNGGHTAQSKVVGYSIRYSYYLNNGISELISEEVQDLEIRKYLIKPIKLVLLQDTLSECLPISESGVDHRCYKVDY